MTATFQNQRRSDGPFLPRPSCEPEAEAQLVAHIRAGEARACEQFVRQYGDRMLAVARRFLRCEEDRADAVQDAFVSAFGSIASFQGHATLSTWLHRIVVNACLTKLRAQSRRHDVPLDDLLPTWTEQADCELARAETRAQVRACIDRLPDPYRTVLLLRDIEEFDTDQTAQVLGITPGAVKTRLHRARLALRTLLEPYVRSEDLGSAVD